MPMMSSSGLPSRKTILALLDQCGIEPHEHEKERVQLAINYRDVLAWQQLGPMSASDGAKAEADARALIEKVGYEIGGGRVRAPPG